MLKIRDVMTSPVISVGPRTALKDVARLLVEHAISGVPVVADDGTVLGVVSEADFLVKERGIGCVHHRPLARILGESPETLAQMTKIGATTAGDAMSAPAITIEIDRSLPEAAAVMVDRRVNRLPVLDNGRLVGMVTRADLVRAYVRSDEHLADAVRNEVLYRTMWLDPAAFEVRVTQGVATIHGAVDRRSTAEMIERIAALVPGVVRVEAAIDWELDDRQIEAPATDYVSSLTAPRSH